MMRILAIFCTAFISGLTAVGALMILQMPAPVVGIGMALLGCAVLLAVICVGLIIQGIPRRRTAEHSAALIASAASPAMHSANKPARSTKHSHSTTSEHDSKSRPRSREEAPRRPNRRCAETRAAENLLNMDSQDNSPTPGSSP